MKKLLNTIAVMIFAAVSLTACGNQVIKEDFKDEGEVHSLKGVVMEKQGDSKGTHVLELNDDEDVAVRSLLFNLSSDEYLGNNVKVKAVYNEEDDVYEITDIDVTGVNEKDDEKDANLVKYKDSNLGIELKYYDDWTALATNTYVSFFSPEMDGGKVDEVKITQRLFNYQPPVVTEGSDIEPSDTNDAALIAYVNNQYSGQLFFDEADIKKIGSAKLNSIEVTNADGVTYYFYRPGLIYEFTFIDLADDDDNELVFGEMLNSFKFTTFAIEQQEFSDTGIEVDNEDLETESIKATSVKTPETGMGFTSYESLPYSFTGLYPDQWYYAGSIGSGNSLHHYGFSDESFEDGEEMISLDILSGSLPSGETLNVDGTTIIRRNGGSELYVELNDYIFKFAGPSNYSDIMLVMAGSLTSTD